MKHGNITGIFNRISTLTIATVFTLTSVASAAVPIFLTQTASATSTSWTEVPFTASEISENWTQDRSAPSGGAKSVSFKNRDNVLELGIDIDGVNTAGIDGYYQTEGLQRQITLSNTIRADLYVDSDWVKNEKTVRAGLWGVAKDETGVIRAYPIVEFTTVDGTGWRLWNSEGSWSPTNAQYSIDAWNTLEITQNQLTDSHDYRVNGQLIGSTPDMGSTQIKSVIINSKNFGEPTKDYDVRWSNFAYGNNPDTANKNTLRISGSLYRDHSLDDCDNKSECENRTSDMLAGWEVRLYKEDANNNWNLIKTNTTDEDGKFSLGSQQYAGTYHICEVLKDGWAQPIQNWSGSGYFVNTPNQSGATEEGPYCATTTFTDEGDRSWASTKIGNVDTGKPTGVFSYLGGAEVEGVKYINNIEDLTFTGNLIDNHMLARTTYVIWKVDTDFNNRQLVCGNWNANSNTNTTLSSNTATVSGALNDCKTTPWLDGNYEIAHRVYDVAGNFTGFNTPTQKFVIDSSRPTIQVNVENGSYNPRVISVAASDPTRLKQVTGHVYNEDATKLERNCSMNVTSLNTKEYTLECNVDVMNLEDGAYTIKANASDQTGTISQTDTSVQFTIDTTAPQTTLLTEVTDGKKSVTITGSAVENSIKSHWFEIMHPDGSKTYEVKMNTTENTHSFIINTSNLKDGEYRIRYVATDRAGNRSDDPNFTNTTLAYFTVDNTAPELVLNDTPESTEKPLITGTVDDPTAVVTVTVDDNSYTATISDEQNNDDTYNWSVLIGAALSSGSHPVTVTATDTAGNKSEESGTLTIALAPATNRNPNAPNQNTGRATDNAPNRLVVTTFNTNDPDVLGATNLDADSDNDAPVEEGQVASAATDADDNAEQAEKELVESTEASTTWYWAIAMVALLGAVYFGYRNFKSYDKKH